MHTPIVRFALPMSAVQHALRPLRRLLPLPALLIAAVLTLVLLGALPSARANASFGGQLTTTHGSGTDWSSDWGSDWHVGWNAGSESPNLTLTGHGTGSSSRAVNKWWDSGFSLDWEQDIRGGVAGDTFSGGSAVVPTAGDVEGRVFNYHLYSELDHGISWFTTTTIGAEHYFTNSLPNAPLYYAMRYALTVVTDDQVHVNAHISNSPPAGQFTATPHQGVLTAGTHTFTGTVTGTINWGKFSLWQTDFDTRAVFGTSLQLVDYPGSGQGSGRAEMFVELVYSASPLTEFPGTPDSVPDGLPMLPVIAAALGGLVVLRRRSVA